MRPNTTPMRIALTVKSAGDWAGETYGVTAGSVAGVAMAAILAYFPATIGRPLVKTTNKPSGKSGGDQISELTTNRLSVYLRSLTALEAAGVRTISSQALAEQFH